MGLLGWAAAFAGFLFSHGINARKINYEEREEREGFFCSQLRKKVLEDGAFERGVDWIIANDENRGGRGERGGNTGGIWKAGRRERIGYAKGV